MMWFVHVPTDRPLHEVLPDTDPTSGIITFSARPSRRSWSQYQDLFAAIGVDQTARSAAKRDGSDIALIGAWLTGYNTTHLVVRHATRLATDTLEGLIEACRETATTLVLTEDDGDGAELANTVMNRSGTHAPFETLRERYDSISARAPKAPTNKQEHLPARLPTCDFYLWRARCRQTLTPTEFEAIDHIYRDAFRQFRDNASANSHEAAERLITMFKDREPAAIITIVRAAQAATFTRKSLLKVDLNTLLASVENQEYRRLTDDEIRSMRIYRSPWLPTIMTLFDANLSTTDIESLRTADIHPDGTLPGHEINPVGLPYLRAQRHLQLTQGNTNLNSGAGRAVPSGLRFISLDLNLPLMARLPINARKADRWQHITGVSLLPLSEGPGA